MTIFVQYILFEVQRIQIKIKISCIYCLGWVINPDGLIIKFISNVCYVIVI